MSMSDCLRVWMGPCVYAEPPAQKWGSGSLELDLQTVVSSCVGAGNQAWVLCQSSQCP